MTNQNNAAQAAEQEVDAIMEQAQVFASSWAFFGGPFDQGDGKEQAEREEKKLRDVIRDVLSKLRAPISDELAKPQPKAGNQYHILKTDPAVFQAVLDGAKTFEIRLNDRGYTVGDALGMCETKFSAEEMRAGAPLVYTGRECQRFVSHVLTGYGLADGWCCLSFQLPHAAGASAPVAGKAEPVAWMLVGRLKNSDPKFTFADPSDIYESAYVPLYDAPPASQAQCSCPSGDGSLRWPCAMHRVHSENDS